MDYLYNQPGSAALKKYADNLVPDNIMYDISGKWNLEWSGYLNELKNTSYYRILGDTLFPVIVDNELSAYDNVLIGFEFKNNKMCIISVYPPEDTRHTWLFCDKPGIEHVKEFVDYCLNKERERREIHMYGIKSIPLKELHNENFIIPSYVNKLFNSEVLPQIKDEDIFNHVLFYSYPGVGKTAYCRYLASEVFPDWQTVIVNPSVIEKPSNILNVFGHASDRMPSVIVFEDVDTMAASRYSEHDMSVNFDRYLGALLNCIDGIEQNTKMLVIATTNNPQILDPAITRPGRFGIQIEFKYNETELSQIFTRYIGQNLPKEYYHKILKNTPAHLRATAKAVRAFSKMNKVEITKELITRMSDLINTQPKFPALTDMFESDSPSKEVSSAFGW